MKTSKDSTIISMLVIEKRVIFWFFIWNNCRLIHVFEAEGRYAVFNVIFEQNSNDCGQLFITLEVTISYQTSVFLNTNSKKVKKSEKNTKNSTKPVIYSIFFQLPNFIFWINNFLEEYFSIVSRLMLGIKGTIVKNCTSFEWNILFTVDMWKKLCSINEKFF